MHIMGIPETLIARKDLEAVFHGHLVLLDGRRLPLSDINGNVDINILPESIIGSVDVITGGASAIYGSDAMSGVVNFKTDRYFDGVRVDIQNGDCEGTAQ